MEFLVALAECTLISPHLVAGHGAHQSAITTYVFKIASRCNLACTYCYMYSGADQSWRTLPRFMSLETAEAAFRDMAHYASSRDLKSLMTVLHGGEPSLYPLPDLRNLVTTGRAILGEASVELNFCVQTNAAQVADDVIKDWNDLGVEIGVSLDLDPASHDRTRVDKGGAGTYKAVMLGIDRIRLLTNGRQPVGAIAVLDPSVAPAEYLRRIETLGLPQVELLLPDETWETANADDLLRRYGDWLCQLWDLYLATTRSFRIRWFHEVIKLAMGGVWGSDFVGLNAAGVAIVETDGRYVFHDALRIAGFNVNESGQKVGNRSLSTIENMPTMRAMMAKRDGLAHACQSCHVVDLCGGGHIVHRYSHADGLNNASVYCLALTQFYQHVRDTLTP